MALNWAEQWSYTNHITHDHAKTKSNRAENIVHSLAISRYGDISKTSTHLFTKQVCLDCIGLLAVLLTSAFPDGQGILNELAFL